MVEITSYPEVYYVGREAAKVWSVPGDSANNYGVWVCICTVGSILSGSSILVILLCISCSKMYVCFRFAPRWGTIVLTTFIGTGYDNPEGAYTFQVKDHIAYRYEYVSPLGDGSFGQCVKV